MVTAACGQFRQALLLRRGQRLFRERCAIGQFQHRFHQDATLELRRFQPGVFQPPSGLLHGGTGGVYHLSSSMSSGMQGFSAAMAHSIWEASGSRVVMRWIWSPGQESARVSQLLLRPAMRMNS